LPAFFDAGLKGTPGKGGAGAAGSTPPAAGAKGWGSHGGGGGGLGWVKLRTHKSYGPAAVKVSGALAQEILPP
jgi:hypothetical protein